MEGDQDDPKWQNYINFIDDIILNGLRVTICVSLNYLAENMEPANNYAPLLESRLELLDPDLLFTPSLNPDDPNGFNQILNNLINDIIKMTSLIPRIRPNCEMDYETTIASLVDVVEMKSEILTSVARVVQEAADYCHGFERYAYLWLEDRHLFMEMFLEYSRMLEQDEIELLQIKDPGAPDLCPPTIDAFREQIDNYESLYIEIEAIEQYQVFSAWFQVDVRPFRQALLNIVCKWSNMFKEHLVNRVTESLGDLATFIRNADEGLLQTVKEGDYEGLVSIMAYLLHVKERTQTTDEMFEPMQEIIDLLKYYDTDIPEEVNVLLQELPEQWANTKQIAISVKQQVGPLQATEVVAIRNRIQKFEAHVAFFRETFRIYKFFQYICDKPYVLMDRVSNDIGKFESTMSDIQDSGSLFEVNVPEFKILRQCRRELRMLKV